MFILHESVLLNFNYSTELNKALLYTTTISCWLYRSFLPFGSIKWNPSWEIIGYQHFPSTSRLVPCPCGTFNLDSIAFFAFLLFLFFSVSVIGFISLDEASHITFCNPVLNWDNPSFISYITTMVLFVNFNTGSVYEALVSTADCCNFSLTK